MFCECLSVSIKIDKNRFFSKLKNYSCAGCGSASKWNGSYKLHEET